MTREEALFTSYNKAVEQGYNKVFQGMNKEDVLRGVEPGIDEFEKSVKESVAAWETTPIEILDGLTPVLFLKDINDFSYMMKLFRLGSKICDDSMPELFLEKLRSYGNDTVNALIELAEDKSLLESSEGAYIPVMAVKVLGEWKTGETVSRLIDMLFEMVGKNELYTDSIKDALINIGSSSIDKIIQVLSESGTIENAHEYLVTALAEAGRDNKSDAIYRCIKDTFMRMENKIIGAICLGNYGDGRAIPALKGYIEKNRDVIDPDTYYEIKSAVHRLGGNVDDL